MRRSTRHITKKVWYFEIIAYTDPYGAGTFKTLMLLQFSSDLRQTLGGHIPLEIQATGSTGITFVGNRLSFKTTISWNFEILTWVVNGEILKCRTYGNPGAESIKQSYDVRSLRVRKATWHVVAVDRK